MRPTAGSTARDDCDSDGTNDGIELKEDNGDGGAMGGARKNHWDESETEPYLTDNDISSLAVSSDGSYLLVGTQDYGITVVQLGSAAQRMRHGQHYAGPLKRQFK